jgi:hypothetical protein
MNEGPGTVASADRFLARTFRASPAYELVLFDHLAPEERAALAEAATDPDFYGVLRPPNGHGGTVKVVTTDTALLLYSLRRPGRLPTYVRHGEPGQIRRGVTRLVLDGILEVEAGEEYVSGPRAAPWIGSGHDQRQHTSRAAALSEQALLHAARLGEVDGRILASVLYGYNRIPVRPTAARVLSDSSAVLAHLGVLDARPFGWRLHEPETAAGAPAPWLTLLRDGPSRAAPPAGGRGRGPRFKLYVSPMPEALPAVFTTILECLASSRARQFKVGADAGGLHRPDKIVVYFDSLEDVAACARTLQEALDGTPAHGVPFTAEVGEDGLLSWGMDPPPEAQLPSIRGRESWRAWVTNRLGGALAQATRSPPGEESGPGRAAVDFALARARADGIDTVNWSPETSIWNAYTGGT